MHSWLERRTSFMFDDSTPIAFRLALIGFLFTPYVIYVEVALIHHALRPFCVTFQVTMTTLFSLSAIRLIRQPSY